MPPRYQQRAAPDALPGVRRSTTAPGNVFGGESGGPDLSGVQRVVAQRFAEEIKRANTIAVLDAESKLADLETRMLHDPKAGLLTRKGKAAMGIGTEAQDSWARGVAEIEKSLASDEQKLAFSRSVQSRWSDVRVAIEKHAFAESNAFDDASLKSFLANEGQAALVNFNDRERVQLSIDRRKAAIRDYAERNATRLPIDKAEWIKNMEAATTSETHLGVLQRYISRGEDLAAKEYFGAHKAEISGGELAKVEEALTESSTRGESQRRVDAILQTHHDRQSALDAVMQIKDPAVRDAAQTRVNAFFNERRTIEKENQDELYLRAANIIEQHVGRRPREVIEPWMWSQLTPEHRRSLELRASRRDEDRPNNDRAWLDFLEKPAAALATMSRADFESKFWAKFDNEHRSRAESLWLNARSADAKPDQHAPTLTFNERVDNALRTTGLIDPGKSRTEFNDADVTTYAKFETEAARRVQMLEASIGRRATGEEIQEVVTKLAVDQVFVNKSWGTDPKIPAGLIREPEDSTRAYVPLDKIPPARLVELRNIVRSTGTKITNRKLERMWAARLLDDDARLHAIARER